MSDRNGSGVTAKLSARAAGLRPDALGALIDRKPAFYSSHATSFLRSAKMVMARKGHDVLQEWNLPSRRRAIVCRRYLWDCTSRMRKKPPLQGDALAGLRSSPLS